MERIGHVSADSQDAGMRADRTRAQTASLAAEAEALTQQVAGIVRTSVPEVDRRKEARETAGGEATLEIGGTIRKVSVTNSSAGGLGVTGAGELTPGQRGVIRVPGRAPLDVEVRHSRDGRVGLVLLGKAGAEARNAA